MAEAQQSLATTKRKFHKLLDNITATSSTTSLASTLRGSNASTTSLSYPLTPEPPNKRPRSSAEISMDRDRSISASQARIQALKEQLLTPKRHGTVRAVGQTVAKASTTTPRKTPNFLPTSQEQFLERLKTFANVKKWTSKPDIINEVEWAKRGWTCDTWNTVACKGGCEKRLAVKLRPKRKDPDGKALEMTEDLAVDIDDKLVDMFKELIIAGHDQECLWRRHGCEDNIYHIPVRNRAQTAADLLDRYTSFETISDDLPLLSNITYPDPTIQDVLERLPLNLFRTAGLESSPVPPTLPPDIVAFTFALFGWTGLHESRISLATCNHCFQRLGLWLSSDTRLKEMSQKLDVPIESLRLNLLESHREHCPWKNAVSQHNPLDGSIANMAAWQTIQFILLNTKKESPTKGRSHGRNIQSVDLGSEAEYPRGSIDYGREDRDGEDETGKLQEKWNKFKAKLRRTTSKKSLKSVKSFKSTKSAKSTATAGTTVGEQP